MGSGSWLPPLQFHVPTPGAHWKEGEVLSCHPWTTKKDELELCTYLEWSSVPQCGPTIIHCENWLASETHQHGSAQMASGWWNVLAESNLGHLSPSLWVSSPGCNTYPVTLASNLFLDLVICHFLKMWFGRSVQATQIYDSAWEEGRKEGWCELWRSVGALMQERKQEIAGMNGKCPSLFLHLRQFIEGPRGEVMATALSFAQWVLSLSGILQRLQAKTLERRKGCCIIQWDFKFWKSITKEPPFPLLKPPSSSVDSQFLHPSTLAYKQ